MCHLHRRRVQATNLKTDRRRLGLHSINNMTHPFKTNARISVRMTTENNWLQWNEIQHGVLIKSAYSTCRCQTSNINEGGETSLRFDHIMGHSNYKYNCIQVNIVPTSPYISNVSSDCTLLVWMLQWGHEVTNWRSPWQHWQSIFMGPKKKNFWVKGWVTLKDSAVKFSGDHVKRCQNPNSKWRKRENDLTGPVSALYRTKSIQWAKQSAMTGSYSVKKCYGTVCL